MSGSVTIQSNRSALCKYLARNTNFSTGDAFNFSSEKDRVLLGFDSSGISSSVKSKRISEVRLYVFGSDIASKLYGFSVDESWTESSVTWNTQPSEGSRISLNSAFTFPNGGNYAHITVNAYVRKILQNGMSLGGTYSTGSINTSRSDNAPYLVIDYGDDSPVSGISSASPSSGYIPKNTSRKFRWAISQDGYCIDNVTVVSSKFRWKESGGTATEINCGTNLYYTLAGSSITADSILWQCEVVDSLGNTATSDWYTISTVEATSSTVAVSPVNTMVDGSSDNLFKWRHVISTGTAPTRSVLKYSTDGSTWTTFADISGSDTSTFVPSGTLPDGDVKWSVRTYNTDSVAGSWSEIVSISVINAPDAPVVSVEQTPRPLISWQVTGQEGYQIRISGVWESGSIYGAENSKKCPVIIPDGEYVVEVRACNSYGLWSKWGSAPLTVANSAGSAITLTATASDSIYLSWTTSGTYERYLVKRDGDPIAVTTETSYTDSTAVGEHKYIVYGIISGSDNYGLSNEITVELVILSNSITDLETGDMLLLPYSVSQIREEQIQLSNEISVIHVSGAKYPFAEVSKWTDKNISFEAAFDKHSDEKRLEAMIGHLVCFKAKNSESVVGILPVLKKVSSAFWTSYATTIEQIDRSEVVEL